MRWDSDHLVTLDDTTKDMLAEVTQSGALDRIAVGMDFFDASINRIAAWTIGARNTKKALLAGRLLPNARIIASETAGGHSADERTADAAPIDAIQHPFIPLI